MSDAERRLFMSQLCLALALGSVGYFVNRLVKAIEAARSSMVVDDVELFLKRTRLQSLVSAEDQTIIDAITASWSNASYHGKIVPQKVSVWITQTARELSGDTLRP